MSDDAELSYQIIGAAMNVHNEIGPGLREKPYENALAIELRARGLAIEQQRPYPIRFRNQVVGDCIPDLTVDRCVLIDAKSIASIGDPEVAQMLNYLRISGKELGLVINFQPPKLEWRRMVRTRQHEP